MKRTPLKRKTALRRKKPMYSRPKTKSSYKRRERATDYMMWVKRQPCAVRQCGTLGTQNGRCIRCGKSWLHGPSTLVAPDGRDCPDEFQDCYGEVQADHAGRRGVGRKAADDTCIPLCRKHHDCRQSFTGPFKGWTQVQMREWLEEQIDETQRAYAARRK